MSHRSRVRNSVTDLMHPLRAVVGSAQSVMESLCRLRLHGAEFAPVVERGRVIGILSLGMAEAALRFEMEATAGELVAGGAPMVSPGTSQEQLMAASRCVAPAVLVGSGRGALLGLIPMRAIERGRRMAEVLIRPDGSLTRRMRQSLGDANAELSQTLLRMATENGLPLYLAGGSVRDMFLGHRSRDLDFVVAGDATHLARRLATLPGWRIARHDRFGTAVVTTPAGVSADLAGSRQEIYRAVATLPEVLEGDMADDARRRDATINSMAIRLSGTSAMALRDDLGGRRDLRAGVLRVHDTLSFVEDPTRALRIARLAARLGYTLSPETSMSLRLANRISAFDHLSADRLRREFNRIDVEASPAAALDAMARMGILQRIAPGVPWGRGARAGIERLCEGAREGRFAGLPGLPSLPLLILIQMGSAGNDRTREAICRRFGLSGSARQRCLGIHAALLDFHQRLRRARRRSRVSIICAAAAPETLALAWATGSGSMARPIDWYLREGRTTQPGVTGSALAAMGLPPGPEYAQILNQIRDARLDGKIESDEESHRMARRLVRRIAARERMDRVDT